MVSHYEYIYGDQFIIDRSIRVHSRMDPIQISIDNSEYNLIMNCLISNILYNDGCDAF